MSTRAKPGEIKQDLDLKFKLVNRQNSLSIATCSICKQIVHGITDKLIFDINQEEYNFFLNSDLGKYFNVSNLELIHYLHKNINVGKNISQQFSSILKTSFSNTNGNQYNQILLNSIFERIFLRIIQLKINKSINLPSQKFNKVELKKTLNTQVSGYGLSTNVVLTTKANSCVETEHADVNLQKKTNQFIICDDFEVEAFSWSVCCYFHTDLPKISKFFLIRYLKSKIKHIIDYTNKNVYFHIKGKNCMYNYLMYLDRIITQEYFKFKNYRVQIFEILGQSGIGKSKAISNFANLLKVLVPIQYDALIYVRANDYWWNNYCGQPIVLYDDIGHSKKSKTDFCHELISVGSGTFDSPPMAFIKDMPFTSSLVFITGNFPIITTTNMIETVNALKRRIVSNTYEPLYGLGKTIDDSYFQYTNIGKLCNTIRSRGGEREIFDLLNETYEILNYEEVEEFEQCQFSFENDETDINFPELNKCLSQLVEIESTILNLNNICPLEKFVLKNNDEAVSLCTSSVPKSYYKGEGITIYPFIRFIEITDDIKFTDEVKKNLHFLRKHFEFKIQYIPTNTTFLSRKNLVKQFAFDSISSDATGVKLRLIPEIAKLNEQSNKFFSNGFLKDYISFGNNLNKKLHDQYHELLND